MYRLLAADSWIPSDWAASAFMKPLEVAEHEHLPVDGVEGIERACSRAFRSARIAASLLGTVARPSSRAASAAVVAAGITPRSSDTSRDASRALKPRW
ncbi:MAG: hypothetical protein U0835_15935 [Isosphaeraceae bacterium]